MATRFSVELALSSVASGVREIQRDVGRVADVSQRAATATTLLSRAFIALGGATAVVGLIRRVVREASEAADSLQRLDAMVAATGAGAGFSTQQLAGFAAQIQNTTRFSDEAAQAAEAALLRYTSVQGQIYQRALQASINIAAATGRDLESVATALGRSLEIPGEALRGLQQASVVLSEAQQRTLRASVEAGRADEARAAILRVLEARYRGVAEAMAGGYAGAMAQAKNQASELMERVGGAGLTGAIEELLRAFARWAQDENTVRAVTILGKSIVGLIHVIGLLANAAQVLPMFFVAAAGKITSIFGGMIAKLSNLVLGWLDAIPARVRAAIPGAEVLSKLNAVAQRGAEMQRNVTQFAADRLVGNIRAIGDHAKAIVGLFGDSEQAIRRTGAAVQDVGEELEGTEKPIKATADEAARLAEQILNVVSALRQEAEAAEGLEVATMLGEGGLRAYEVAQARLNAALQLAGTRALPAVIAAAEDYAERAVRARHRTEDWTKAQDDLKAANDRLAASIERIPEPKQAELLPIDEKLVARSFDLVKQAAGMRTPKIRDAVYEPFRQAFGQMRTDFLDVLAAWATGAEVSFRQVVRSWLSMWARAMLEWLARWIAVQVRAKAAQTALGAAGGAGGGGGGWMGAIGSLFGGGGGAGGAAAGLSTGVLAGAAFAALAAYIAYKGFVEKDYEEGGVRIGGMSQAQIGGTYGDRGYVNSAMEKAHQVVELINSLTKDLGLAVEQLGGITIGKANGRYFVDLASGVRAAFASAEEAMQYASIQAIKTAKLGASTSELVRAVIAGSRARTTDEFSADIQLAQQIDNLGLTQVSSSIDELNARYDEMERRIVALLGPSDLLIGTLEKIRTARIEEWQALRDQITGVERDPRQQQLREMEEFNRRREERERQLAERMEMIQTRINRILAGGMAEVGRMAEEMGRTIARGTNVSAELLKQLQAELAALQAELAALPPPITETELRRRGGGGGGGRDRAEERAGLREEAARMGVHEIVAALLDAQQRFDDFAERVRDAGFKGAEAAALIATAEEELAAKRREIVDAQRAASHEFITRGTVFGGPLLTGLQDISREAQRLQDNNRALASTGQMTTREMRDLNRQIREAARAQRELLIGQETTSLLGDLYTYLGDEQKAAQLRHDLAVAELQVRREQLAIALREYGLDQSVITEIDELLRRIRAAGPPRTVDGPPAPPSPTFKGYDDQPRIDLANKAVDDALARLVEFERAAARPIDALQAELLEVNEAFAQLREALGDTERVQSAYTATVGQIIRRHLEPLLELQDRLLLSEFSPLSAMDRFFEAQKRLEAAEAAMRRGDLSGLAKMPDLIQEVLREAQAALPTGSQAYLSVFRRVNELLQEARRFGESLGGGAATPSEIGAAAFGGAPPAAGVSVAPVVTELQTGRAEMSIELRAIRTATEASRSELSEIRRLAEEEASLLRGVA